MPDNLKQKNLIFVGSGGFAKEIYSYIKHEISSNILQNLNIKGFLDESCDSFLQSHINEPFLGNEDSYDINENDYFIVAIGSINIRDKIIKKLENKKAKFYTFISSTSFIAETCKIEEGVIICPYCMVNADAVIKQHSVLNIYSSIAHESVLGEQSVLSPYCTLNGNVKAGKKLFMGTKSTILPGISIGNNCTVAAGTVVRKNLKNNTMVYLKAVNSFKPIGEY